MRRAARGLGVDHQWAWSRVGTRSLCAAATSQPNRACRARTFSGLSVFSCSAVARTCRRRTTPRLAQEGGSQCRELAARLRRQRTRTGAPTADNRDESMIEMLNRSGALPSGRTIGRRARSISRDGNRLGGRALRRQHLRRLEPARRSSNSIRRASSSELRRGHVRLSARHPRRSRRQRLGHRRARAATARDIRSSSSARTAKVLLTLGKAGRRRGAATTSSISPPTWLVAPNGDIFVADGHATARNARIVKFTKDGKFIKTWGKRLGAGRVRTAARLRDRLAGAAVRRRPREQPHPDLRSGRQVPRRVEAVRPPERHLHRQERRALCRRFRVERLRR